MAVPLVMGLATSVSVGDSQLQDNAHLGRQLSVSDKRAMDMDGPVVTEHGGHHHDSSEHAEDENGNLIPKAHSGGHHHGMPILEMDLTPEERLYWTNYSTVTYFNTPSLSRNSLYLHIVSYVGTFLFLYPFVLVLWNVGHSWYFPLLTVHSALALVSAISFFVFESSIDDIFPKNAFSTMTTILFIGTICHWALALIASAYSYLSLSNGNEYSELDEDRDSIDSPSSTLRGSTSSSDIFELDDLSRDDSHMETSNDAMRTIPSSRLSQVFLSNSSFKALTQKCGRTASTLTSIVNWAAFAYFFVYLGTGVATYSLYGQGKGMFNLLAHFIKGGVFFVLGLVTLARYCGAFRQKGWAWNHVFVTAGRQSSALSRWFSVGTWTMEMVESALILFYGSTNIFLEHLSNPGGEWSAKDLQHVSIAFIFIGCGLCGVLLERKLADWRQQRAVETLRQVADEKMVSAVQNANPGFSPNPFPLVTIFWMGYLMSQHDQESQLATDIHKQWGNMFVYACAFRIITYLFFLLAPVNKNSITKPQMPMSELVVAFGLIAGGLIFMESCSPIVHSMEYYGYTPMFSLNLTLGVVTLIMAWEMTIFTFKDHVMKRGRFTSSA